MSFSRLNRFLSSRAVFWSYALFWTLLLLVPDPEKLLFRDLLPPSITSGKGHWDKLVHGSGYLGLFVLAAATYASGPSWRPRLWVIAACVAHAALTEIGQLVVPNRNCDVLDWLSDVAGILVGLCLLKVFRTLQRSPEPRPGS